VLQNWKHELKSVMAIPENADEDLFVGMTYKLEEMGFRTFANRNVLITVIKENNGYRVASNCYKLGAPKDIDVFSNNQTFVQPTIPMLQTFQ